ncbi:MAG TPA: acetamidase/formamidase family protein [Gemmatimonadales bacterium]|nr:acetamidase/formamidase family protein [Gemmatimonadales bacterium]
MAVETGASLEIAVDVFTDGTLDPGRPMLGPVQPGGRITAETAPGCWGPMITPAIRGGHEVTQPVAVAGARVGDAVVLRIAKIEIASIAGASGNDRHMEGRYLGDPYVAGKCPGCGLLFPPTHVEGTGPNAVKCDACGADAAPFTFTNGYTVVFDQTRRIAISVPAEAAERIGSKARRYGAVPAHSQQNSILVFAASDIVGMPMRARPFLGQCGTMPAVAMPDSHNAGDFGSFLVGASHPFAITAEQLEQRTDGHMDIDAVREGAILVCPVKVEGAGVYLGDMHAMQGDGEIAGHTVDVSGRATLEVDLLRELNLDGPVIFPVPEDLPFLAQPLTADERGRAEAVGREWGLKELEETLPISVVGTGPDLNAATDNGLARAAKLLGSSVPEVMNRATVTGAIEIGRHPGVVHVTFRAPLAQLEHAGLLALAEEQYGVG